MATLKDTLVLGKLTVVDKIVKSGGLPTSILTGDGSMASVGSRADSTATTGNSGQIYLVQRNAAGQLVVDVPWSAGSGDVVATSVAAGGGIDVTAGTSSYTVSHKDTSTATSVDGSIVNKITIDGYGHVTALGTTTIDLGSYIQGSGMTKDEIVIASNGTSIKTTGYYIQTSFDGGANKIPTSGAIKTWVEGKGYTTNAGTVTGSGLTDNQIIIGTGGVGIEASGKTISTSVGADDTTIPTSKAIKTYVTGLGYGAGTVTGSGTKGYIAKWNSASALTNGPAFGSDTTKFLRNDGSWAVPSGSGNVVGSGLTANTIIVGDGGGAIKSSGYSFTDSFVDQDKDAQSGENIPNSAAVINYVLNKNYVTGNTLTNDFVLLGSGGKTVKSSSHIITTSVQGTSSSGGIPTVGAVIGYVSNAISGIEISSSDDNIYSYDEDTGTLTILSGDSAAICENPGVYTPSYSGNTLTVYGFDVNAGGRITEVKTKSVTITSGGGANYYHTPTSTSGVKIATGTGVNDLYVPTGTSSSTVASGNHNHDTRYYTKSQSDDRYYTKSQSDSYYTTPDDVEYLLSDYYTKSEADARFVAKCLLKETKITMADRTYKNIEDLKPGDLVLSIDLKTGEQIPAVVLLCQRRDIQDYYNQLVFENGSVLKINWSHDIYSKTKETWILTDCELDIDEIVLTEQNEEVPYIGKFDNILPNKNGLCEFYDLVVSNSCYYANGILCAHNPIRQRQWLYSPFNKVKNKMTKELEELVSQFKDENMREANLVQNQEYMDKSLNLFIQQRKKERALQLYKQKLAETDYVSLKINENTEITEDMKTTIKNRQEWRSNYNASEKELNDIYEEIDKIKKQYDNSEDLFLSSMSLRKKYFLDAHSKSNEMYQSFLECYQEEEKND
jgi:hypothetical protein